MNTISEVAPPFVEIAHRIVWATVATVDSRGRPRSRVLHPIWESTDDELVGWIGTGRTPAKTSHLASSPFVSVNYWDERQDVATAECGAEWHDDDATCERVWAMFRDAPAPIGYDPAMIPAWTEPTASSFSVLRLQPWRLRVFPGSLLLSGQGEILEWRSSDGG